MRKYKKINLLGSLEVFQMFTCLIISTYIIKCVFIKSSFKFIYWFSIQGCCQSYANEINIVSYDFGGNSEKSRQDDAQEENTRPGSSRKKRKQILPMWMLATSSNVLENDSSESRASVNSVQPSAAHYTNKQTQNKKYSFNFQDQKIKKSQSNQTNKQTN